jgi:hypothetical protein
MLMEQATTMWWWCGEAGTVDGVGGEAQTQKINGPPCAVPKIDGVKVGRGGGVIV